MCSNDYLTLSPVERHTNSRLNCLECLAHGRVCFQGFMQPQESTGHTATIIRIRCIFCTTQHICWIWIHYSDRI